MSSPQSPIRRHTDRWRDSKVGLWRRYSPRELTQEWAFPNKTIKLKALQDLQDLLDSMLCFKASRPLQLGHPGKTDEIKW